MEANVLEGSEETADGRLAGGISRHETSQFSEDEPVARTLLDVHISDEEEARSQEFCAAAKGLRFAAASAGDGAVVPAVNEEAVRLGARAAGGGGPEPTFLFLSQNIGGIEASTSLDVIKAPRGPTDDAAPVDSDAGEAAETVTAKTRREVADFLADLRSWVHRVAVTTERRRRWLASTAPAPAAAPNSSGTSTSTTAAERAAVSAPPAKPPLAPLSSYSPLDEPPQLDVVVMHFQEVGGKYHSRAFNDFFAAQLKEALLPEAGWTSGLLMDYGTGDRARSATGELPGRRSAPPEGTSATTPVKPCTSPTGADSSAGEVSSFTAIASVVFLSPRMVNIASVLSFPHRTYLPVADDPCSYGGSAANVFRTAKFSTAGRSRKGFLLLSLRLGTSVLNLCNVHLFHDEDNRVALEQSPSKYAVRRTDAMLEAMAETLSVVAADEPLFVFGDCNCRVDGQRLAEYLRATRGLELRAERKAIRCPDTFWPLFSTTHAASATLPHHALPPLAPASASTDLYSGRGNAQQTLRELFDSEPRRLMDAVAQQSGMELAEMPVRFAPTYSRLRQSLENRVAAAAAESAQPTLQPRAAPTAGDTAPATHQAPHAPLSATVVADRTRSNFTHERIPAWCDRVFFNPAGLELLAGDRFESRGGERTAADVATGGKEEEDATRDGAHGAAYLYDAVSLLHTDHDGVFLSF